MGESLEGARAGTAGERGSRPPLWCVRAGRVPYPQAVALQERLRRARQDGVLPDLLLLLEHPPTYTRGRRSTPDELPMGTEWYRAQGIEVHDTDRGGRVTYHGPGQLVGYPIVSLRAYGDDVHAYVRRLEQVVCGALAQAGVQAGTVEGLTGVWTGERRKIGSIGIHVSRGVTTHGFSINVNNDLQPFEWIVPCGIDDCRMSSVAREREAEQDLDTFASLVAARFAEVCEQDPEDVGLAAVEELVAERPAAVDTDLAVPA